MMINNHSTKSNFRPHNDGAHAYLPRGCGSAPPPVYVGPPSPPLYNDGAHTPPHAGGGFHATIPSDPVTTELLADSLRKHFGVPQVSCRATKDKMTIDVRAESEVALERLRSAYVNAVTSIVTVPVPHSFIGCFKSRRRTNELNIKSDLNTLLGAPTNTNIFKIQIDESGNEAFVKLYGHNATEQQKQLAVQYVVESCDYITRANTPRVQYVDDRFFQAAGYRRIIVVGDVHGCFAELEALLRKCGYNGASDCLLFLGDLVNKGPDSERVVQFAIKHKALCVMGNHDSRVIALSDDARKVPGSWSQVSAKQDRTTAFSLSSSSLDYLRALPHAISYRHASNGNYLFVHAGVDPTVSDLSKQKCWDLMNVRSTKEHPDTLWCQSYEENPIFGFIYYGHCSKGTLHSLAHSRTLDTGCVGGNELTAAIICVPAAGDAVGPFTAPEIVSVPAKQSYMEIDHSIKVCYYAVGQRECPKGSVCKLRHPSADEDLSTTECWYYVACGFCPIARHDLPRDGKAIADGLYADCPLVHPAPNSWLKKRDVCNDFKTARVCAAGHHCPNTHKRGFCKSYFVTGNCSNIYCHFAHSRDEFGSNAVVSHMCPKDSTKRCLIRMNGGVCPSCMSSGPIPLQ